MIRNKRSLLAIAAGVATLAFATSAARTTPLDMEHAAVERAVLDYVEALYDVKPEYIERSVHSDLAKYGFWRKSADEAYVGMGMTRDELLALAGEWNADGTRADGDSPRKVEVLDMLDQTASVKLTAKWGIDYMHLARYNGKWQIAQVMWQSHPPSAD